MLQVLSLKAYPRLNAPRLRFPEWTFGCYHRQAPIYFSVAALSFCWSQSCFLGSLEVRGGSQFNTTAVPRHVLFLFLPQRILEKSALNPATFSKLSKHDLLTQTSFSSQILSIIF